LKGRGKNIPGKGAEKILSSGKIMTDSKKRKMCVSSCDVMCEMWKRTGVRQNFVCCGGEQISWEWWGRELSRESIK
jgi:hypothetical protein